MPRGNPPRVAFENLRIRLTKPLLVGPNSLFEAVHFEGAVFELLLYDVKAPVYCLSHCTLAIAPGYEYAFDEVTGPNPTRLINCTASRGSAWIPDLVLGIQSPLIQTVPKSPLTIWDCLDQDL